VIAPCVTSLLNQGGAESIHIFLVDDASTDGTAQIARDASAAAGRPESLTLIPGRPLPLGWTGKLWAVEQGIKRALEIDPRYILLTDADIVHDPGSISALVASAETGDYDLTSLMVKFHCRTLAEKLLIPAFVYFFFQLYPPAWIADPQHATAGAAGGCILVRPQALVRAGGIEAIRNEIIDDCALARAVKHSGGKVRLGLTDSSISLRIYPSFSSIGRMISRGAFSQLRHSALLLLGTLAGLAIVYLLPVALLFTARLLPVALGSLALLLMAISYSPMIRFYRLNPLWSFSLPLIAIFYMGATVHSALKFWRGTGGEWKGRTQDTRQPHLP
jgi:hopene-associated glycosyltransferase HpnB